MASMATCHHGFTGWSLPAGMATCHRAQLRVAYPVLGLELGGSEMWIEEEIEGEQAEEGEEGDDEFEDGAGVPATSALLGFVITGAGFVMTGVGFVNWHNYSSTMM